MRIYEGSPRQDYEEVLRSIGAFLDQRGMREILVTEAPDGFIIQGLVAQAEVSAWSDPLLDFAKESATFRTRTSIARSRPASRVDAVASRGPVPDPPGHTRRRCGSSTGTSTSSSLATSSSWSRRAPTSFDC